MRADALAIDDAQDDSMVVVVVVVVFLLLVAFCYGNKVVLANSFLLMFDVDVFFAAWILEKSPSPSVRARFHSDSYVHGTERSPFDLMRFEIRAPPPATFIY